MNGKLAHEKMLNNISHKGKCKLKLWVTIKCPLEWLKVKMILNVDEHMEQLEFSYIVGGSKKMIEPFWKKCLAVSLKTKHTPTLWPSDFIPSYLPKRNKTFPVKTCRIILLTGLFIILLKLETA